MEYKMYCVVEKHLSPIQKAIQAAHAIVEYQLEYGHTDEYKHWAQYDKTIVVLDGGSAPEMVQTFSNLTKARVDCACFMEPDLNNMITAEAILVDERVWNYEKYGRNYEEYNLRAINDPDMPKLSREEWINWIGGETAAVVKAWLSSLRISQ